MRLVLLLAVLALAGCDSDDDERFFAQTAVSGIVLTDELGEAIGGTGETRDDWDLRDGSPDGVFVRPVYPNPIQTRAAFDFVVPTAQRVRGVLVDRDYREVVVLFDGMFEAEAHRRDFERPAGLSPGLYRFVAEGDGWGTYGDVRLDG